MTQEAMLVALNALENQIANVYDTESNAYKKCAPAITAIKAALAQPEQASVQESVKPTAQEMQNAASNLALMREMWGEPN